MSKYILALSLVSLSSAAVVPAGNANIQYVPPPPAPIQASPGFVHMPLTRKPVKPLQSSRKRQSLDPLRNDISGYSITITLGTPPQTQYVDLDTGSNELWVNPLCSTSYYPAGCAANGAYTPGTSSTGHNLGTSFSINYGIGSVSGIYYTDNMTMGGAHIVQQQFGDASTSQSMMQGILGIAWGNGVDTSYNNVIDNLKAQGITQSKAFGLNLASIDISGAIIFGGIDVMKYSGSLQKMPIIPKTSAPDRYARYWFYMNQVSITPPGATTPIALTASTYNQPVFPDSGSTFCQLPSALFTALLAYFPLSQVNQGSSTYTVNCSYRSQAGYINFAFGNVTVSVSYHEFIWFDGAQCWFAAQPTTNTFLLGDSFMRSAYIVYDQDNSNILIAPAANCGTSIIAISTGVNAVPSVNGGCAPTYTPPAVPATSTSTKLSTSSSVAPVKTSSSTITSSSSSRKLTTSSPIPTSPSPILTTSSGLVKSSVSTISNSTRPSSSLFISTSPSVPASSPGRTTSSMRTSSSTLSPGPTTSSVSTSSPTTSSIPTASSGVRTSTVGGVIISNSSSLSSILSSLSASTTSSALNTSTIASNLNSSSSSSSNIVSSSLSVLSLSSSRSTTSTIVGFSTSSSVLSSTSFPTTSAGVTTSSTGVILTSSSSTVSSLLNLSPSSSGFTSTTNSALSSSSSLSNVSSSLLVPTSSLMLLISTSLPRSSSLSASSSASFSGSVNVLVSALVQGSSITLGFSSKSTIPSVSRNTSSSSSSPSSSSSTRPSLSPSSSLSSVKVTSTSFVSSSSKVTSMPATSSIISKISLKSSSIHPGTSSPKPKVTSPLPTSTTSSKLSSSLRSSVSVYVSAIIPTVFNTVQIALTQLASTVTVSNQYTVTAIASTLTVTAIASTITITETAAAPSVQALTVTSYAAVTADALSGTPIMIYATVTAVAPSVPPVVVTSYTTLTAAAPTVASATFTCTSGVNC